jgi:glycosyltransferase involved in cell wall biosynthesis
MICNLTVPSWVRKDYLSVRDVGDIPEEFIQRVKKDLEQKKPAEPVISIGVIAYNEEKMILSCLSSLASQQSRYPIEIIVSNNNSKDRTQEMLDRAGAISVVETSQGVGFARQAAMDKARGKYMLCADADALYPPTWADTFVRYLEKPGISAVYSVDSYIPDGTRNRFSLLFYELLRDFSLFMKGFNRPELNVGGGSFGFRTDEGRSIGWHTGIRRGEDGAMAFALKKFGKIKFIVSRKARIWTTTRSLEGKGSLLTLVLNRAVKEVKRIHEYFRPEKTGYKDRDENLIK